MSEAARTLARQNLRAIFPPSMIPLESASPDIDFAFLPEQTDPRYLVGFAISERARQRAFRLRYQVFNLELGEGLQSSHSTGLDSDQYDAQMAHLVLLEKSSGTVVGTYRLQTVSDALKNQGIYSAEEFDLTRLSPLFKSAVECGRACVSSEHRGFRTIFLLWAGIAAFLNLYRQRYLFGCCSLTSTDPVDGWRALETIRAKKFLHPEIFLPARPDFSCAPQEAATGLKPLSLPKLFRAYMTLGARVISEPAIDRAFRTVDFLVMLDAHQVHMSSLDLVK